MGLDLSKPLSLKGFWGLITIRHHYLLETLLGNFCWLIEQETRSKHRQSWHCPRLGEIAKNRSEIPTNESGYD